MCLLPPPRSFVAGQLCLAVQVVILRCGVCQSQCENAEIDVFDVLRPLPEAVAGCPRSLGRCALVGGSSTLHRSGHGRAIERHDTVIRVNRLPHPRHYGDVGKRTDIYFVNLLSRYRLGATRIEWEIGIEPRYRWCQHSVDCNCTSCPRHIVFEGAPMDDFWTFGRLPLNADQDTALLAAKAAAASVEDEKPLSLENYAHRTVCRQSHALHFFEHSIPAVPYHNFDRKDKVAAWKYTTRPTGGLKAFLTFSMLCHSITLFGFSGTKSIDGHRESNHNFVAEHALLNRLANTNNPKRSYRRPRPPFHPSEISSLLSPNLHNGTRMNKHFYSFAERILCLASNGKIAVVP